MTTQEGENELWLSHRSCRDWEQPDMWARYFERVQMILGAEITHLDEDDPIKRRFRSDQLADEGRFVTKFGDQEGSRWLFGRMATIGVDFSIWYFRDGSRRANSINWHGPPSYLIDGERVAQACQLFDFGNVALNSFYGYADTQERQARKKKEYETVDLEKELGGVFWLTYFNERYVDFFGRERFASLKNVAVQFDGGATLRLGDTPHSVPDGLREDVENALGSKSFVRHRDFTVKHPGKYALTYEQLRS